MVRAATSLSGRSDLTWRLLGIHTSRMDVTNRDLAEDDRLNLNCAWYADVLRVLTQDAPTDADAPSNASDLADEAAMNPAEPTDS